MSASLRSAIRPPVACPSLSVVSPPPAPATHQHTLAQVIVEPRRAAPIETVPLCCAARLSFGLFSKPFGLFGVRGLCVLARVAASVPPPVLVQRKFFLERDPSASHAAALRLLLLRAGVEPNPGPGDDEMFEMDDYGYDSDGNPIDEGYIALYDELCVDDEAPETEPETSTLHDVAVVARFVLQAPTLDFEFVYAARASFEEDVEKLRRRTSDAARLYVRCAPTVSLLFWACLNRRNLPAAVLTDLVAFVVAWDVLDFADPEGAFAYMENVAQAAERRRCSVFAPFAVFLRAPPVAATIPEEPAAPIENVVRKHRGGRRGKNVNR